MAVNTEKTEPAAEQQPFGFSGLDEAMDKAEETLGVKQGGEPSDQKTQEAEPKTEEKETPEKTKLDTSKQEESGKAVEKATGEKFYLNDEGLFVDKEGNPKPRVQKIDGKDVEFKSLDEYDQFVRLGYHHDQRGRELNEREAQLNQRQSTVQMVIDAYNQGRLVIKDAPGASPPSKESAEPEETFDYSDLDPDVAEVLKASDKRYAKLEKEMKTVRKQNEDLQKMWAGQMAEKAMSSINSEISAVRETYPLAFNRNGDAKKAVWDALAEVDDKTGMPRYKTTEEAVKAVHAEYQEDMKAYLEKENYIKATPEKQHEIVADYLSKKEEEEKAPVSSPAVDKAGPTKPKGKEPITGIEDAMERFAKDHGKALKMSDMF